MKQPMLTEVLELLDKVKLVTVAAIHGTCFGGGLELALTCHYRVGVPSCSLGLPEVGLGLLPGAGGTQRLPRVIGVAKAIELITTGRPMKANEARELGVLDSLVAGEDETKLLSAALAYAERMGARARSGHDGVAERRVSHWPVPGPCSEAVFDAAARQVAKTARGFLAPTVIVEAIRGVMLPSFAEGMAHEQQCFFQLFSNLQSRALQSLFFAEREASKVPGIDASQARPLRSAGVIGAGTMGAGIATCLIDANVPVVLVEGTAELCTAGLARVRENYAARLKSGKMSAAAVDRRLALVRATTDYGALANVDIVIEAVFEKLSLKREIFARLDGVCKDGALLCTNTSSLDIDAIAGATRRPADVVGTHFFSPANVMPLLENVRGRASSESSLATVMALGKLLKKKAVLVGNCHGFVANRIFFPYTAEALALLAEGAYPEDVDRVLVDFGIPIGPLAMSDVAGLDVGFLIRRERAAGGPVDSSRGVGIANRLYELGRYGRKSGKGFFRYDTKRHRESDDEVRQVVEAYSREAGIQRRSISDSEILQRTLYPVMNEAFKCLEEGIALRHGDIDVISVFGYGFPAYRGGLMFYAEQELGLDVLLSGLRELSARFPDVAHFTPSKLLVKLVTDDETLKGWAKKHQSVKPVKSRL